ncbi:MAG: HAMP domain-containing protein, partial [Acidimicrobiia bacterium]|nr:HAMP domain-containing protein [Acidimicrobiia bacterium]
MGISVLDSDAPPDRDFSTRPEVGTALTGIRSAGIRRSDTLNADLVYVAVPVASGGNVHGALRLTIDAHEVNERIQRFWLGLAGVAIVVLLAVAGIGFAIARSVTRPLRELQESAKRFAGGDLTPAPVGDDAPPEVQALGATMNTMALRLDQLLAAQRAFVSDASHQLRTPL